ncbi:MULTISPECIES: hypothetical protein [Eikenella]|nr:MULTISPECIES: hypothetical protein [Eikenella]
MSQYFGSAEAVLLPGYHPVLPFSARFKSPIRLPETPNRSFQVAFYVKIRRF